MNLNPFEIRYGYHAALRYGRFRRRLYASRIERNDWPDWRTTARQLPISVVAMAGASCVPEMARCLGTFLNFAGQPNTFRIVSDGTLSKNAADGLCGASKVVEVLSLDEIVGSQIPPCVIAGMRSQPLMRKLALLLSLPDDRPWLFIDSDIEFFAGAEQLLDDMLGWVGQPRFMKDVVSAVDARLIEHELELDPAVNSGFLYLPGRLNWHRGLARLERLADSPARFTEQTVVHLAMQDSNAMPLDPARYILSLDDQFEWRDRFAKRTEVVCRHYVGTLRHKMWNRWSLN